MADAVPAEEHLEPRGAEVAGVEGHRRLPDVDVRLRQEEFERAVGRAIVHDEECRHAEPSTFVQVPGKTIRLVAYHEARQDRVRIDVDRADVQPIEAIPGRHGVVPCGGREGGHQRFVQMALIGKASEAALADLDGVVPALMVHVDLGEFEIRAFQVGVEIDDLVKLLGGADRLTQTQPSVRKTELRLDVG